MRHRYYRPVSPTRYDCRVVEGRLLRDGEPVAIEEFVESRCHGILIGRSAIVRSLVNRRVVCAVDLRSLRCPGDYNG